MQASLFSEQAHPPLRGLLFIPELPSIEQEHRWLEAIATLELSEARYKQYTARRRVKSFGGQFDYDDNELRPADPIPEDLALLRDELTQALHVDATLIEHMLVAEYRPGTPLGWHRDVPDFESVIGISLLGNARMKFRPYPPPKGRSPDVVQLDLPPRSVYVMEAEARWNWQHTIVATKELRYSVTMRTKRGSPPLLQT